VFVVRESFSSERVVRRGRDALASVNAHVVGVVLTFVRPRAGEAEPYFATYVDDKTMHADTPAAIPAPSGAAQPTVSSSRKGRGSITTRARSRSPRRAEDA